MTTELTDATDRHGGTLQTDATTAQTGTTVATTTAPPIVA
jgi:hypothetical protein